MIGRKKILMIVIIIIVVLAVASAILGYLYIKTDFLKSDKILFEKYFMEEIQNIQEISKSNTYKTYSELKKQNIYESTSNIDIKYSEGGEISSPFNNLGFSFTEQRDNDYNYRNAKILLQDENYLEVEGIKNQELYGIRFTNEIKQFLSVRNTDDMQYLEDLGISQIIIQNIMDLIDNKKLLINEILTEEEFNTLINKYFSIIKENIEKAKFDSQKNTLITVNNNTVKTNVYIATLEQNQIQEIINQLLNSIKEDEIILNKFDKYGLNKEEFTSAIDEYLENLGIDKQLPNVKISVYVKNGEVLRTILEYDVSKITIENSFNNNTQNLKIQRNVLNDDAEEEQTIQIEKTQSDVDENYNIKLDILDGTEQKTIEFNIQMKNNNGNIETVGILKYVKGIINVEISLQNTVSTLGISEKINLDETNNIILTDLDETTKNNVLNIVKTEIPVRVDSKIKDLIELLNIQSFIDNIFQNQEENEQPEPETPTEEPENPEGEQMSQVDINRFNAKFEFYTGNEVSSTNVETLLDISKSHLNSVEISETGEIKLIIEKDKENIEQMNKALEQIEEGAKYKVLITYKDSNGIIDYITINKIEQD